MFKAKIVLSALFMVSDVISLKKGQESWPLIDVKPGVDGATMIVTFSAISSQDKKTPAQQVIEFNSTLAAEIDEEGCIALIDAAGVLRNIEFHVLHPVGYKDIPREALIHDPMSFSTFEKRDSFDVMLDYLNTMSDRSRFDMLYLESGWIIPSLLKECYGISEFYQQWFSDVQAVLEENFAPDKYEETRRRLTLIGAEVSAMHTPNRKVPYSQYVIYYMGMFIPVMRVRLEDYKDEEGTDLLYNLKPIQV